MIKCHKLAIRAMYDWSYGEKVFLTAWSPIPDLGNWMSTCFY